MSNSTYLTKTLFKIARQCTTKLYYGLHKEQYPDTKLDDDFVIALAGGGCQVGELAKYYFPGGNGVTEIDHQEALIKTNELLKQDEVTIYEAAIKSGHLFVRADILVKKGNSIRLIEVKAKSCDGISSDQFKGRRIPIKSEWCEYIEDVAFQKYVTELAFPDAVVTCSLMLPNKQSKSSIAGLHQKFRIVRERCNRTGVVVSSSLNSADLAKPILSEILVDELVEQIFEDTSLSFIQTIQSLEKACVNDEKLNSVLSSKCNTCEFRCPSNKLKEGFKSGFDECWSNQTDLECEDLTEPLCVDLWYPSTEKHLEKGLYRLSDLTKEDIKLKSHGKIGLSRSERQWIQIEKLKNKDDSVYVDYENLKSKMDSWTYPLHMIDFETSTAAIPFFEGMKPYEQTAFQYSHHVIYEDGSIEHKGELLITEPGVFPNYKFLRQLRLELKDDNGTIFRFHNHENTVLCAIYKQLLADQSPPSDRDELIDFIKEICRPTGGLKGDWEEGDRCMVDLQDLVVKFYYDPETGGSNSIKQILPAMLKRSLYLQEKYSHNVYGTSEYPSKNFKNHTWINTVGGRIQDPYKTLKPLFDGCETDGLDLLFTSSNLADGGAALTAYGMLQFVEMSDIERIELNQALLRYCELDTLAMVMIVEEWFQVLLNYNSSN